MTLSIILMNPRLGISFLFSDNTAVKIFVKLVIVVKVINFFLFAAAVPEQHNGKNDLNGKGKQPDALAYLCTRK